MITIGVDIGGPELEDCPIELALVRAMSIALRERDTDYKTSGGGWVNPIYIVPGSASQPEFTGYELCHFSKTEKGLVVQIAVPQSVADGEGIPEFVGASLREAVRLAAAHFASKGTTFSSLKAEKIILAIEAGITVTGAITPK
jgi:hypothetical protein